MLEEGIKHVIKKFTEKDITEKEKEFIKNVQGLFIPWKNKKYNEKISKIIGLKILESLYSDEQKDDIEISIESIKKQIAYRLKDPGKAIEYFLVNTINTKALLKTKFKNIIHAYKGSIEFDKYNKIDLIVHHLHSKKRIGVQLTVCSDLNNCYKRTQCKYQAYKNNTYDVFSIIKIYNGIGKNKIHSNDRGEHNPYLEAFNTYIQGGNKTTLHENLQDNIRTTLGAIYESLLPVIESYNEDKPSNGKMIKKGFCIERKNSKTLKIPENTLYEIEFCEKGCKNNIIYLVSKKPYSKESKALG